VPRGSVKRYHNLPAPRVRLIGREQDGAAVREALLDFEGRLLTLTGTGGCGKTRLALEVASSVDGQFAYGVALVELAAIADPALVPQAVAAALGIRERPDEPLTATLVRVLSTRDLLLVLDNCEHVIEVCAEVTEQLLDNCPRLRVLATSREPLRIPGEKTWRVPSLTLPDQRAGSADVLRSAAVELFVERAQAASSNLALSRPMLDAVGRICFRLEGMPLAIELAAARVRALGVEQILERLDDSIGLLVGGDRTAPSRQQALRATLDWSYRLLEGSERAMFHRLAAFVESYSLEAIEAVCADGDVTRSEVLDLVTRLVDKSLVVVEQRDGHARYRLLEPVRQYAQELLVASGERDVVRRRHAQYYCAFAAARAHDANIGGPRRFTATNELGREYANIRTVLAWSMENGEPQVGLSLAWSLAFFWQMYNSVWEGCQWVDRLLALPGAEEPTFARAGALVSSGYLALLRGDLETAWAHSQEASSLGRRLGEPELEWMGLQFRGVISYARGDVPTAQTYLHQAARVGHDACVAVLEGSSLSCIADNLCELGDYAGALALLEHSYQLVRVDPWCAGGTLETMGKAALGLGDFERARSTLEASLAVAQLNGEPHFLTPRIFDSLGDLEIACNQSGRARAWLVRSLETRHDCGERFGMVRTIDRFAALAALGSDSERALRLMGAADRILQDLGAQRTPAEQQMLECWLLPLRERVGDVAADAPWIGGRALTLDEAVAFAHSGDVTDGVEPVASARRPAASPLTAREQEVAVLLARGLSNRQIADELVISLHTAQRHVENILSKLALRSRTQVAAWAIAQGLAPVGTPANTP
jgi:predicted ATPase/DNA-binding CsgD family transcriptional regulator